MYQRFTPCLESDFSPMVSLTLNTGTSETCTFIPPQIEFALVVRGFQMMCSCCRDGTNMKWKAKSLDRPRVSCFFIAGGPLKQDASRHLASSKLRLLSCPTGERAFQRWEMNRFLHSFSPPIIMSHVVFQVSRKWSSLLKPR